MKIYDITKISGLSRGQIDQLISRHGVHVEGEAKQGASGRTFTARDALKFCVAGALDRLGLDSASIRDVWHATSFEKIDPETGHVAEIYPGASDPSGLTYLVIKRDLSLVFGFEVDYCSPEHLANHVSIALPTVVISLDIYKKMISDVIETSNNAKGQ